MASIFSRLTPRNSFCRLKSSIRLQHTQNHELLEVGNSFFARCYMAESIKYFTQYLIIHPGNFEALNWRGKAFCFNYKFTEALDDFKTAERCNEAPYNLLAMSEVACLKGNTRQGLNILQDIMKQHPSCGESWAVLGSKICATKEEEALQLLKTSVAIGNSNGDVRKPWHYWSKNTLGNILLRQGDVDASEQYYSSAVQYCISLTAAHIGVGCCSVIKGNVEQAEISYRIARELNTSEAPWETFLEFKNYVERKYMKRN